MERSLGVIVQPLEVIFVLRYSDFWSYWCLFCLGFMGYEIMGFRCSIFDLSGFNLFIVCYTVSIMLGYDYMCLDVDFWV